MYKRQVLIGAGRMTKAVEKYQKPMLAEYSPEKIYEYLKAHPEYEKIVLLKAGEMCIRDRSATD